MPNESPYGMRHKISYIMNSLLDVQVPTLSVQAFFRGFNLTCLLAIRLDGTLWMRSSGYVRTLYDPGYVRTLLIYIAMM